MIFDLYSNLKYKFGNRNFRRRGDYVSTVGFNEASIAKYIREADKQDQVMDKASTKELGNPFNGQARESLLGLNKVKASVFQALAQDQAL